MREGARMIECVCVCVCLCMSVCLGERQRELKKISGHDAGQVIPALPIER